MTEPDTSYPWPAHWSEEAVQAVELVLEAQAGENGDTREPDKIKGAPLATLLSVGELLTTAAALEAVARAAGYMCKGSMGQDVIHPAGPEARQARTAATRILNAFRTGTASATSKSVAGATLARKRWDA